MGPWPVELHGETPTGRPVVLDPLRRRDGDRVAQRAGAQPRLAGRVGGDRSGRGLARRDVPRAGAPLRQGGARRADAAVHDPRSRAASSASSPSSGSRGARCMSAAAGYWVDRDVAGQGIAPTALALAGDHVLGSLGLHRIEVNIRPENANSLAVVRKLGFRDEGLRRSYLHINGAWRDHRTFAVTTEDLRGGTLMERLHNNHTSHIGDTPPHVPGGPRAGDLTSTSCSPAVSSSSSSSPSGLPISCSTGSGAASTSPPHGRSTSSPSRCASSSDAARCPPPISPRRNPVRMP